MAATPHRRRRRERESFRGDGHVEFWTSSSPDAAAHFFEVELTSAGFSVSAPEAVGLPELPIVKLRFAGRGRVGHVEAGYRRRDEPRPEIKVHIRCNLDLPIAELRVGPVGRLVNSNPPDNFIRIDAVESAYAYRVGPTADLDLVEGIVVDDCETLESRAREFRWQIDWDDPS